MLQKLSFVSDVIRLADILHRLPRRGKCCRSKSCLTVDAHPAAWSFDWWVRCMTGRQGLVGLSQRVTLSNRTAATTNLTTATGGDNFGVSDSRVKSPPVFEVNIDAHKSLFDLIRRYSASFWTEAQNVYALPLFFGMNDWILFQFACNYIFKLLLQTMRGPQVLDWINTYFTQSGHTKCYEM